MSQVPHPYNQFNPIPLSYATPDASTLAVSRFFNAVYAWMCAGLAVTATVAWFVSTRPDIWMRLGIVPIAGLFIVELVLVGVISSAVNRINAAVATLLFMLYAAINGVVLSGIFLVYTHAALASAFAVASGMFGAMSLYGFLTRRDLSGMGSLLFMALIGLIIASFVGFFWHNSFLQLLISYVGVVIFVGLTAYDTQKLKAWAMQTSNNATLAARLSVNRALVLYLDFLNLFLFLLRIMGDRRN